MCHVSPGRHTSEPLLVRCPGNTHRDTRHLVEDRLRGGDPDERRGGSIVSVDERLDLVHQVGDAAERTPLDRPLAEQAEPPLHLVQPGRRGGREVQMEAWSRRQPPLTWPHPADRVVLDDYLLAIDQLDARLAELDAQLATVATTDPYREPVGWLRCFRGIDTLTAMLLLAELHDVQRFPTARALMAYLGLVPGEHSSGERHRRGPITKTGNTLARRLVVEAAWHYRHRPGVSRTLAQRRSGQPPRVIALADKAQQRLCRRFRRLAEHKPGPVVTVAVARELVRFLWAALHPETV